MTLPPPGTAIAIAILALIVLFAIFGSLLTPCSFDKPSLLDRNMPPMFLDGEWSHLPGTDRLGRDMLHRLVVGTRISIGLALVGTIIGMVIGVSLGLLAARETGSRMASSWR